MDQENNDLSRNLGGDCLSCMAKMGDPDAELTVAAMGTTTGITTGTTATTGTSADTLTVDDIQEFLKVAKDLDIKAPNRYEDPFNLNFQPRMFQGVPMYEVPVTVVPKIQLTKSFADKWLTKEATQKINAKLVDMLGTREHCAIERGHVLSFGDRAMFARPEMMGLLNTTA